MPLPIDILRDRVRNEVRLAMDELPHTITISDPSFSRFPFQINVTMINSPGPSIINSRLVHRYEHQFQMHITTDYPYEKPIVRWKTSIFHPNIMSPSDGGYVCTRLLDDWTFKNNLVAFIKGVEVLLANPNPKSPYATETCLRAAQYFSKNKYNPPKQPKRARPAPRVVVR